MKTTIISLILGLFIGVAFAQNERHPPSYSEPDAVATRLPNMDDDGNVLDDDGFIMGRMGRKPHWHAVIDAPHVPGRGPTSRESSMHSVLPHAKVKPHANQNPTH
jgi:hypothetical protein